ncbi:MAG: PilZ domain-containing protein [Acidimicrobiales bacterium]
MEQRRRRLPRETAGWRGRYRFDNGPAHSSEECRILDLSLIGVGVEVFGALPEDAVGRHISVEVETPAGASVTLRLNGVVRNTGLGQEGGTRLGVEFTGLSETERAIIDVMGHMRIVW